jgi:lipoate-protein ligase A
MNVVRNKDFRDLAWLDLTLATVEENLALDEALLVEADQGRTGGVLRLWEPETFAVVLGASRRIAADVDLDACRAEGVPVVRRSSGGGTVVIGPGALNVTVVLPQSAALGLAAVEAAQRFVLERMAAAVSTLAPGVELRGSGDLALLGCKCAGSAQRRLKHWFLVHVSILCHLPLERVVRYLREPDRQPAYRAGRRHEEFLRNLGVPRRIVGETIRAAWCPADCPPPAFEVPRDLLETLLSERFANRSWVERL